MSVGALPVGVRHHPSRDRERGDVRLPGYDPRGRATPVAPPDRLLFEREPANAQLLISGSSQHGAFGAGVPAQWKGLNGGHLPRFSLIMGVSTGAMLGTFAVLDEPETAARTYAITSERDLLTAYAHKTASGSHTLGSWLATAMPSGASATRPRRPNG